MGCDAASGPGDPRHGPWVIWAVDPQALDAHLVATFEDHGPALAALLDLQASSTWAAHRLVLTSRGSTTSGSLPVQRIDDAMAWASCLVECADGRRHVRA